MGNKFFVGACCMDRPGGNMLQYLISIVLIIMVLITGSACSTGSVDSQFYDNGGNLVVEVKPGRAFTNWGWAFIIPFRKGPQMAAWVENEQGDYVGTLFATGKTARQNWVGANAGERPESLPVWTKAVSGSQVVVADAVTTATPVEGQVISRNGSSVLPAGKYTVLLEVNHSYDWNGVWARDLAAGDSHANGVNGQPSLVYQAVAVVGAGSASLIMQLKGRGSVDGSDGLIHPSLDGMDTALEIIESAVLRVRN